MASKRETPPKNRLREYRDRKGWSQADVAFFMNINPATVSNHESGQRAMDGATIKNYAKLFEVDAMEIYFTKTEDGEFKG